MFGQELWQFWVPRSRERRPEDSLLTASHKWTCTGVNIKISMRPWKKTIHIVLPIAGWNALNIQLAILHIMAFLVENRLNTVYLTNQCINIKLTSIPVIYDAMRWWMYDYSTWPANQIIVWPVAGSNALNMQLGILHIMVFLLLAERVQELVCLWGH